MLRDWVIRLKTVEKLSLSPSFYRTTAFFLRRSKIVPQTDVPGVHSLERDRNRMENSFFCFQAEEKNLFDSLFSNDKQSAILHDILQRFAEVGDDEPLSSILSSATSATKKPSALRKFCKEVLDRYFTERAYEKNSGLQSLYFVQENIRKEFRKS